MTAIDIERLLRQPAPDEPAALPALLLPQRAPEGGRFRDYSMDTRLGLGRLSWTARVAIAAMLLAGLLVAALVAGAVRLEQLRSPLLRAGEYTGRGIALTYPSTWERVTPDWVIEDGSNVAMIATNTRVDGCSVAQVGTLTPEPASLGPDGAYYSLENQYGKIFTLADRIYACMIERPMRDGEVRLVLALGAPQKIQIGPFGDFEGINPSEGVATDTFDLPTKANGYTETIGGMPAKLIVKPRSAIPGGEEVRTWIVATPNAGGWAWFVQAVLRGPDVDRLREDADRAARSLVFTQLPDPLDEGARDAALAQAIDRFDREQRRSLRTRLAACFPRTPGEATVTVADGPTGALSEPAEVTCSTTVEPTEVRLWRVRLVVTWAAQNGVPAGRWGQELLFDASGAPGATGQLFGPETSRFPNAWTEPLPAGPPPDLAPGDLVRAVGADLQSGVLNRPLEPGGPSDNGNIVTGAPGSLYVVVDGPVRDDGLDWYRFDDGQELAWAVPYADGRPLVEVVEPSCPATDPPSVEDVVYLPRLVRHLCYGDRELTFTPAQYARREDVGGEVPVHEPAWLATDIPTHAVFGAGGADGVDAGLPAVMAPGVDAPRAGAWVTVTGHFNDPASTTCRWDYPDDWSMERLPLDAQQRRCTEHFVITSLLPASAP